MTISKYPDRSLRAREEIAQAFERLFPQYKRDGFTGGDRQDYEMLKAALLAEQRQPEGK